jgi:PcfJ-like protein
LEAAAKNMIAGTIKGGTSPHEESAAIRRRRRVDAFHASHRRFVADLTRCSPALEDLCDSFPALLFALATGYATPAQRERTFELILAGASLREAADALGVAWWLRKLPPQAFVTPLPSLPTDPSFALRISGMIPAEPRLAATWLTRVAHAQEACGPSYALWVARQSDLVAPPEEFFLYLAAWAWFSEKQGHLGHRLLRKPWHAEISLRRAREELSVWRQRLRLLECLGLGIETPWLSDGAACGYNFVALRTVDDFVAESQALDNCLDQYADHMHAGVSAIFSVRKGAKSVACVEIGLHEAEMTMPTIVQLRAARNRRAPPEVWQATFAWLGSQRLEPLAPERHAPRPAKRAEARRQLWAQYLEFLVGTRHHEPFRRLVLDSAMPRSGPRRRPADLQLRLRTMAEGSAMLVAGAAVVDRRS